LESKCNLKSFWNNTQSVVLIEPLK
jgi:hypothetical protein